MKGNKTLDNDEIRPCCRLLSPACKNHAIAGCFCSVCRTGGPHFGIAQPTDIRRWGRISGKSRSAISSCNKSVCQGGEIFREPCGDRRGRQGQLTFWETGITWAIRKHWSRASVVSIAQRSAVKNGCPRRTAHDVLKEAFMLLGSTDPCHSSAFEKASHSGSTTAPAIFRRPRRCGP